MAITTETNRTAELVTDGAETDFDFSMLIHAKSEIQVWYKVTGGDYALLTLDTNYTVAFTEDGGTVTTIGGDSPYAAGVILIIRHLPITQQTNWLYNDNHTGEQHQDDFDRTVMRDLQIQEQLDRCVGFAIHSSTSGIEYPEPLANNIIGWDAGGTALENKAGVTGIVLLPAVDGNIIVGDGTEWIVESGNTARASLGLGTRDNPTFSNCNLTGKITVAGQAVFNGGTISSGCGLRSTYTTTSGLAIGCMADITTTKNSGTIYYAYGQNFSAKWAPSPGATVNGTMFQMWGGVGVTDLTLDANESKNFTINEMVGYQTTATIKGATIGAGKAIATAYIAYRGVNPTLSNPNSEIGTAICFYDPGFTTATSNWGLAINTQSYINANLSIGKDTAPAAHLHIIEDAASSVESIRLDNINAGNNFGNSIKWFGAAQSHPTGFIDVARNGAGVDFKMTFGTTDNITTTDASTQMTIDGTGNVGIGTTSPSASLEVVGAKPAGTVGGFHSGMLHVRGNGTAEFSSSVITGHSSYNGNTQLWYVGSTSSLDNNVGFINRQNADMSFWTNDSEKIRIKNNGNIGIGEVAPETLIELSHVTPTITSHCTTHTDSADARAATYQAFGEQSGGEETTLGKFVFAHDGSADDEKAYWKLFINTGSDVDSPTQALEIGSDLLATFAGTAVFEGASVTVGKASTTTGTLILHDSNSANTITLTVPDISAGSLSFTLPATDGDNTNILQTDGNGALSWVALDNLYHDGDGYRYIDVNGVKTKVYTKILTGTTDADAQTSVAHGATTVLSVSGIVYNGSSWGGQDCDNFELLIDGANILINGVAAPYQSQPYKLRIDYV